MRVTAALCGMLLVGVMSVGVLSSCTSDDDTTLDLGTATSPSPTTVRSSTTSTSQTSMTSTFQTSTTSTIVAGTTTTAVVATSVPVTDPPTTISDPTTVPADLTTTIPPATPEDQVTADYLSAHEARLQCAYSPEACDYAILAIPGSPDDTYIRDRYAQRIRDNIRPVVGHGEVKIKIENVTVSGDVATLIACNFDTIVLFNIADPATPDDDVVVNDHVASFRVRWEMRLLDGRWLPYEGTNLEQGVDGVDICGLA
jgi:hypothetical protein